MTKSSSTTRNTLIAILLLSFTASFMLFMLSPLSLFFQAPSNFVLGLDVLLLWYIVFTIAGFAVLSIVLILLWKQKIVIGLVLLAILALFITYARFALGVFGSTYVYLLVLVVFAMIAWVLAIKLLKDKAISCALLILLGCIFAAYIQMLFLNDNMVIIGEHTAPYRVLSLANIMNLFIWLLIVVSPLVLWVILRKKRQEPEITKELVIITAVILCVQVATLSVTAITTPRHEGQTHSTLQMLPVLEPLADLSSEENIVVFLLDSLGTDAMMEALERYPELNYQLDGFTFYRNNISNYWQTFPAVTAMLTTHIYEDNVNFFEYFRQAWSQESFIDSLRTNGFRANLHTCQLSSFGNVENLIGRADNLRAGQNIARPSNILTSTSRLSAGIFAPYLMKEFFLVGFPMDFGNTFVDFVSYGYNYTIQHPNIGNHTDLVFYEFINQNTFMVDNENSVFNFIFLTGAHQAGKLAYDTASEGLYISSEFDEISAIRATFHIINTYFNNLRELGVYDNTTVIILSDHTLRGYTLHSTTPLLIKPKGTIGRLQFNDEAELSNKYLAASILQIAGLPHEHLGVSFFDLIDGMPPPPRFFYYHTCWWTAVNDGTHALELERVYEVTGDANNPENWRIVD